MSRFGQRALLLGVAAAAVAAGLLLWNWTREAPPAIPASEPTLMQATLTGLDGASQRLDQWQGKVVVVNFWATWCAPCREEIPALIRVQAQLGPQGVQVVGIAIDRAEKVRPYAAEMGINYPLLLGELDAMDLARAAGNELGGLPYTVVIDRAGSIVHTTLGGVTEAKLHKMLRPLL